MRSAKTHNYVEADSAPAKQEGVSGGWQRRIVFAFFYNYAKPDLITSFR